MIMLLHSMEQQSKSVDVLVPSWKPQKLVNLSAQDLRNLSSGTIVVGGYDGGGFGFKLRDIGCTSDATN